MRPLHASRDTVQSEGMVVRHAILTALLEGPAHGHAIGRRLMETMAPVAPVNLGQVYATLGRLASRNWVTVRGRSDPRSAPAARRRVYSIGRAGRRAIERFLDAPLAGSRAGDEIVTKIRLLLEDGSDDAVEDLRTLVRAQAKALARLEDGLGRLEAQARADAQRRTYTLARLHLRIERGWLEDVIGGVAGAGEDARGEDHA